MYSKSVVERLTKALSTSAASYENTPLDIVEKRKAPSPDRIRKYRSELVRWVHSMQYNPEKQSIVGIGGQKKVRKFIEKELHHHLFAPSFTSMRSGESLPDVRSLSLVRFITNPYKLPDIGGQNGALTKYLRSIPLNMGSCYPTAIAIASRLPEVKVVFGLYQAYGLPNLNTKALDSLPVELRQLVLKVALARSARDSADPPVYLGGNKSTYWFRDSTGLVRLWHRDRLWEFHAWNEYKGKHFDPLLYKVLKEYKHEPNWQSVGQKRFIHWNHYYQLQKVSFSRYKENQLHALEMGAINWLINDALHKMDGWDPKERYSFPSSIPSRRAWIRELAPVPSP